jgi:YesN/AraC family two-component response regulator
MEPLRRCPLSILVVEDDELIRRLLKTLIAMKFPDVPLYVAENGRMGLDLFVEHTPELVITDVNMPVMNGIRMAGEIRSIKADTRIIVVTAYDDADTVGKFKKIGFNDYLVKPIDFGRLCAAIAGRGAGGSPDREA